MFDKIQLFNFKMKKERHHSYIFVARSEQDHAHELMADRDLTGQPQTKLMMTERGDKGLLIVSFHKRRDTKPSI